MSPERAARLEKLVQEMDSITREIGPRLIRLSHLRQEAREILEEDREVRPRSDS